MRTREHFRELFKRRPKRPHRVLRRRIVIALGAILAIDVVGTVAMRLLDAHEPGGKINNAWDAFFFTTVQLLTVSSQMPNPITTGGRIVDILLELAALGLVTSIAGFFANFFLQIGDTDENADAGSTARHSRSA